MGGAEDRLLGPLLLLLVGSIDLLVGGDVRREICRDQVEILADRQGADQGLEDLGVLERALLDRRDDALQSWVHGDTAVSNMMIEEKEKERKGSKD